MICASAFLCNYIKICIIPLLIIGAGKMYLLMGLIHRFIVNFDWLWIIQEIVKSF